jgi:threonylcarbamoyladenosine tRNA methylthiotransferase MtaB
MRIAIGTIGCKVNQYESEAMAELLRDAGYEIVPFEDMADIYIINTCSVTSISEKKSRQMVHKARERNEDAKVLMVGCYVQADLKALLGMKGVDGFVGNEDKGRIAEIVSEIDGMDRPLISISDIRAVATYDNRLRISRFGERVRAFVKVQDGCDNFCSYCRIPMTRGRGRSRNPIDVLEEIERLVENGVKEVVLTGVDLGSYGRDLVGVSLEDLLSKIIERADGIRIRLSSILPRDVTDELLKLIASYPYMCKHLHIPLQSGDDPILEAMGRPYRAEEYRDLVRRIRNMVPDIAITTDLIVGFPGEDSRSFRRTAEFIEEMGFSRIHVFRFSPRPGTPAASMKGMVPEDEKKRRAEIIGELGRRSTANFLYRFIGKDMEVLIEEIKDGMAIGLTSNYIKVLLPMDSTRYNPGDFCKARIIGLSEDGALGEIR